MNAPNHLASCGTGCFTLQGFGFVCGALHPQADALGFHVRPPTAFTPTNFSECPPRLRVTQILECDETRRPSRAEPERTEITKLMRILVLFGLAALSPCSSRPVSFRAGLQQHPRQQSTRSTVVSQVAAWRPHFAEGEPAASIATNDSSRPMRVPYPRTGYSL